MEKWNKSIQDTARDISVVSIGLIIFFAMAVALFSRSRKHQNYIRPNMSSVMIVNLFLRCVILKTWPSLQDELVAVSQLLCGFCKLFEREKIICFVLLPGKRYIYLFKPETVEVLLSRKSRTEKASDYRFLSAWVGTSLLLSSGDKWRSRRKLLTPAFHSHILEDFLPIFDRHSRVLRSELEMSSSEPWVDAVPLIARCALDNICVTAMGIEMNPQIGHHAEFVSATSELNGLFLYRFIRPWLWMDLTFDLSPAGRKFKDRARLVHTLSRKIIRQKKQSMMEAKKEDTTRRCRAFLDLLLDLHLSDGSLLTEEDIREEVDLFLTAGFDTTTMAICMTLYNLGLYPDVQEKVREELDFIFGDDLDRAVTKDDVSQMEYLSCVIKEAMRLYPPVAMFGRESKEDISMLNSRIPAGSQYMVNVYMLHRDPESFPDPEKFDPERFFPENCTGRNLYAYIPFSAGSRNCIAQKYALLEVKTIVSNILRHFRVESLDHRDKVRVYLNFVSKLVDPLRMRFIARP